MTDIDRTILLVEDDELLRDAFSMLLEDAGYQVMGAGTAARALELARERLPALIVLDLGLPDRPGLEVVRTLKADAELKSIPVVALTGRVGSAEEREALDAGCNRYLVKPVSPSQLLQELPSLIAERSG